MRWIFFFIVSILSIFFHSVDGAEDFGNYIMIFMVGIFVLSKLDEIEDKINNKK